MLPIFFLFYIFGKILQLLQKLSFSLVKAFKIEILFKLLILCWSYVVRMASITIYWLKNYDDLTCLMKNQLFHHHQTRLHQCFP